jgi:hypothetical protein
MTRHGFRAGARLASSAESARASTRLPGAVVRGSLDDGMKVCLGLLESDPERFELAAVAWHTRWCAFQACVPFADSRAALAALEALSGQESAAAARALSRACRDVGLDEVAAVLDAWREERSEAVTALPTNSAKMQGPSTT